MKSIIIPVAAGLVGAGAGFYFGFVYGDNKGRREVWALAEAELNSLEERIKRRYKVGEWSEPTEYFDEEGAKVNSFESEEEAERAIAIAALKDHVENGQYATLSEVPDGTIVNIFVEAKKEKDEIVEEEIYEPGVFADNPNRHDPEPLIITELEYMQDEEDYEKLSISWFPGDRVLVDSKEKPIDDVEATVGINNLNHLGVDQSVIYVRNNKLEMDFEIAIEAGTYRETVLGEDQPVMERTRRKPRAKAIED